MVVVFGLGYGWATIDVGSTEESTMKIVPQSVELLFITPNAAQFLERAGRTCYKSEDKITKDSATAFVKMIHERGHESVVEHAVASFRVICDRGCCYSDDTDVLTSEGWRSWPDVCGDERFATLGPHGQVEFQPASVLIRQRYDGEMYNIRTSLINLLVTPEHSMYVQKHDTQAARRGEEGWQLLSAEKIAGKRVSYKRDALRRSGGWNQITIDDFITEQGNRHGTISPHTRRGRTFPTGLFAKFLGYWLAEGGLEHTAGSSYQIQLYQNVGPALQDMLVVLREMGYEPAIANNGSEINKQISICDVALYHYLLPYHGAINKRIPRSVLQNFSGADLLQLLLCHVVGDGSVHSKTGHMQAYTISPGLADDLQEAALYAGISATTWIDDRVGKLGGLSGLTHRHPCHVISYVTGRNTPLVNHGEKMFHGEPHERWEEYHGNVYCVTVPNHLLYVRRNGRPCWSGNSHEFVRHRLASYSQESSRYCNYSKAKFGGEITVIEPPGLAEMGTGFNRDQWRLSVETAERCYLNMIEHGCKPEIARSVLPTCLKTEFVVTANFREWLHFIKLRTSPKAHPQMREVAGLIRDLLVIECPEVFGSAQ